MNNKIEMFYKKFPLYIWGYIGIAIISISSFITAIFYENVIGDRYSLFRYFISELGEVGISKLAFVFNWGLIISGIPMIIFMFGLALRFKTILGYISSAVGIYASINYLLVGAFPMDVNMEAHIFTAMSFFYGGMAAIILFSLTIFLDKKRTLPKYVGWLGIGVVGIFASFLFLPLNSMQGGEFSLDPTISTRPNIWWLAFFEWLVFFAVLSWIGLVSTVFLVNNKSDNRKKENAKTLE